MKKGFFLTTFLVVFLDMLGVSIIIPILAPLFLDSAGVMSAGATEAARTITLGLLIAIYPIMQFFGAPILGALSDRHGRKRILTLSLLGTFLGYVLFAIGIIRGSLPLLFFSRALDGFTGGNISVVLSAIADVSKDDAKARNFGLIGMAFGLGFVIGPYVGGVLADSSVVSWFTFATPFWAAAALSLITITLVLTIFHETCTTRRETPVSLLTGFKNLKHSWEMKHLRLMFIVIFLLSFGFTFFTQFSQVFYIQKFDFTQRQIGNLFGYIGLWIAITQGIVIRPVSRRFSPEQVLNVCIPLTAVSLLLILAPSEAWMLYVVMPFVSLFHGLTAPNQISIVSNLTAKDSQGEILGINQSIMSAAMVFPPMISGAIVTLHMNLPIAVSGIVTLLAWLVFLSFRKSKKDELFHEV